VRRDALGGKRGDGNKRDRRIRRPDPTRVRMGEPDASLTGAAGLAAFGAFLRRKGVPGELKEKFSALKDGAAVIYPMEAQIALLLDANVVGEHRVFGLEALAVDKLFAHLAGGVVPSLDTVYRDLARFDAGALQALESMMAHHGLHRVDRLPAHRIHLDIDTTVEPLHGKQEGALPGPNPRYHGRPSYHPILAYVAESNRCVGGLLRPGDRGLGVEDVPTVRAWVRRTRQAVDDGRVLVARADAGADCTEILRAIDEEGAFFVVKARLTRDLRDAIAACRTWKTVDSDAEGRAVRQVAVVHFHRAEWLAQKRLFRVVVVRDCERDTGKQVHLWPDLDFTVQAYLTNDWCSAPEELAKEYAGRAEVEAQIAELKSGWGIGKVPSQTFNANHAMLLIKMLAHNLLRRFVEWIAPTLATWRVPWLRRVLIAVPGRLSHSGRQWTLHVQPGSPLNVRRE